MLVVTKMDLEATERKLDEEALQTFARKQGMPIMYTSAKEGKGVDEAMLKMVEMCQEYFKTRDAKQAAAKSKRRRYCCIQ
jgi:Fe2+ transport system protein B